MTARYARFTIYALEGQSNQAAKSLLLQPPTSLSMSAALYARTATQRLLSQSCRSLQRHHRAAVLRTHPVVHSPTTHHGSPFHTTSPATMPADPTQHGVSPQTDPSVALQLDTSTPVAEQLQDLYAIIDKTTLCMLNTQRAGADGPVGRAMGVAKRRGPDLLFLANAHSDKFADIKADPRVQVTFSDSMSVGWVSISGRATVTNTKEDSRVRELWSRGVSAWFGDLGDGVHDGGPEDPRMALIEVRSDYVSYWKKTTGTLGFFKEVGQAVVTGEVAQTGVTRRIGGDVLAKEREREQESA